MENNERDRKLDQWLDEALSQYSAAEPRLGLEQRVLAHVSAEEKARAGRRTWWRWMPAFAAIAAVLVVAVAVRPYWEDKQKAADSSSISAYTSAPMRTEQEQTVTAKLQGGRESEPSQKRATLKPKKNVPQEKPASSNAPVAKTEDRNVSTRDSMVRQDAAAEAKDMKKVQPVVAATPARNELMDANSAFATNLFNARATAPEINQQGSGAAAGVGDGQASASKVASSEKSETVELQAASPVVDTQHGIVATEKVATMPDVSKTMKAMKVHAKPKGPLAKKLEENVETVMLPGMGTVRMNLKPVPAGPIQQFPSPSPLSKEEEMMLAAAKKLKTLQATDQDQSKSDAGSIVIKKIDIAPLPGPPK